MFVPLNRLTGPQQKCFWNLQLRCRQLQEYEINMNLNTNFTLAAAGTFLYLIKWRKKHDYIYI